MPYLLFPGGECPAHELKPGRSLLGRTEKCSIVVSSEGLSREHAAVDLEGGHVYVSDLGSKNGVFVNDKKAEGRVRLADGDKVRFGLVDALFVGDQVAAPAPAPRWGQGAQAQAPASAAPTALPPPELAKFAAQAGAKPVPADLERFMKNVLAPSGKPAEAET